MSILGEVMGRDVTGDAPSTTPLYIPPGARPLETKIRRIGLQGYPGTGKTTFALKAPNVIVADFDNNNAYHTNPNILAIPFWNPSFINEELKVFNDTANKKITPLRPPNRRDGFKKWLRENGPKFVKGQTFVLDSWTFLQNAFDQQTNLEPFIASNGSVDTRAFWGFKIKYSTEIVEMLDSMQCTVVVCFHEQVERDDDGRIIGILPLMQGQFRDQIAGHFTDFFRCVKKVKGPDNKDIEGYFLEIMRTSLPHLQGKKYVVADWNETFGKV